MLQLLMFKNMKCWPNIPLRAKERCEYMIHPFTDSLPRPIEQWSDVIVSKVPDSRALPRAFMIRVCFSYGKLT